MDINQFWAIVDKHKDGEYPGSGVADELAELTPEEIVSYETHFTELVDRGYCWRLWGAAYIMHGGCSDDSFDYFRFGLVSRGRDIYQAALADPDSLADLSDDWIGDEDFGAMAFEAYMNKTGKELPFPKRDRPLEPSGEDWDFDDDSEAARRLPRMWAKYGQQFPPPEGDADKKPWWKFW